MLAAHLQLGLALLAATCSATQVTNLVLDVAGGLGTGSCSVVVSLDDSPDVEVQGCPTSSDGITVNTSEGPLTVKCDVNGGGPNGANQCLNQRVVCRSGCCGTVDLEESEAACTIPDFCTGGDCLMCAEQVASNAPVDLTC